MAGQYDDLVGELKPGETGWLPLDDEGVPNGPATKEPPPGPNAKACSVMVNATEPLPPDQDLLMSSTGATLSPPLQSNVDRRFGDPPPPTIASITSLNPASCGIDDPDFTLEIIGTGFDDTCEINFAGQPEPTTLTPAGSLTTGVKPSLWANAVVVPVYIKKGYTISNTVQFEFQAPEATTEGGGRNRGSTERGKRDG